MFKKFWQWLNAPTPVPVTKTVEPVMAAEFVPAPVVDLPKCGDAACINCTCEPVPASPEVVAVYQSEPVEVAAPVEVVAPVVVDKKERKAKTAKTPAKTVAIKKPVAKKKTPAKKKK